MLNSLNILAANDLKKTIVKLPVLIAITLFLCGAQAQAAPPDTMPVWRIQIYLGTATFADAGTDDNVKVQLNDNNSTWLRGSRDAYEFERGRGRSYDLRLDGVSQLRDIDYLRVSKTGSDGWAFSRAYLIVNERVIYAQGFPSGQWLDDGDGFSLVYFLDDYFMRQRSEWINYAAPTRPNEVPRHAMVSRIESLVGDYLSGLSVNALYWQGGPGGVEIWTLDADTWRVDLDLKASPSPVVTPGINVDFDLTVSWTSYRNGRPAFSVTNISITSLTGQSNPPWLAPLLDFLNNGFRLRLNEMLKNYGYPIAPTLTISPEGNLHFIPFVVLPPVATAATLSPNEQDRQTSPVEMPDDNPAPLSLRVTTGGDIKPLEETDFTARVKSGLTEDADVEVVVELPAPVSLASAWVEVKDADGARWLAAQVESQGDGPTVIRLRDRLAAGKAATYTLRVVFQDGEAQAAQINTRVVPVDTAALTERAAALRAVTFFRLAAEGIKAQGTVIYPQRDKEQ